MNLFSRKYLLTAERVAQSLCISDSAVVKLNIIHFLLMHSAMTRCSHDA